jgi:hypothetical protein
MKPWLCYIMIMKTVISCNPEVFDTIQLQLLFAVDLEPPSSSKP